MLPPQTLELYTNLIEGGGRAIAFFLRELELPFRIVV